MVINNNDFNKIQINEVIDKDGNGNILKRSLMLNIRSNDVDEADELYRQVKAKFSLNPASQNSEQNNSQETVMCACGKPMRIVSGRNGKFYGCIGFPECRKTKELGEIENVPVVEVEK